MQLTQYKCFFSCQKQIELLSVLIAKFFVKSSSSKPNVKVAHGVSPKVSNFNSNTFLRACLMTHHVFVQVPLLDTKGKTQHFSQW